MTTLMHLCIYIFIIIYPLTARVVGAPQIISQPFCSSGPAKLQACPFPHVVFPPLPLSALSSSSFHCALQDVLDRPDERETCPYSCSLHMYTMVRRPSCRPIACWILTRTSSLVTWSLYEMRSVLRSHLISMACTFCVLILHHCHACGHREPSQQSIMTIVRKHIYC